MRWLNFLGAVLIINFACLCTAKEGKGKEPTLLEGDIIVTNSLLSEIGELKRSSDGIGVFDALNRGKWPNGFVPYTIKGKRRGDEQSQLEVAVLNAADEYHDKLGGCITWKFYYEDEIKNKFKSYVTFFRGQGCYSSLGRQSRPQVVSLQVPGCTNKLGTAVHEMMHALGFFHEQSRMDRDNYINIDWNNIKTRMRYNFEKYRPEQANTYGEPYDYKSIMHYGQYAFSMNGKKTIQAKYGSSDKLGQREGLSEVDVKQLRKYYECDKSTGTSTSGSKKKKTKPKKKTSKKKKRVWCGDKYANCKDYRDRCNTLDVVKKYCKKTCNLCPKSKKRTRTRTRTKPKKRTRTRTRTKPSGNSSRRKVTSSSGCKDKSPICDWRRKKGSSCFSQYMKENCQKTCGRCSSSSSSSSSYSRRYKRDEDENIPPLWG